MSRLRLSIDDAVLAIGVRGAFAVVEGLDNDSEPKALAALRTSVEARLALEVVPGFVETDPILHGFRRLHDAVGRSNRRFPSSAESLVGLYQRKGIVPRINPAVDIYNLVSLETRLSLGAHDIRHIRGDIRLCMTEGNERFLALGADAPEQVPAGEYAYVDDSGEILCRLEYRQCERTRVTTATRDVFCILQGHAGTPTTMLEGALARWVELTTTLCGGRMTQSWILG
jgi:DNA/RNA-binding domain of Phe-tRNA-synthetase-like protein